MEQTSAQLQIQVRFPGTIDGFNEEFCRVLYTRLQDALKGGTLLHESAGQGDSLLNPGFGTVISYLLEQTRENEPVRYDTEGIERLLAEVGAFLKMLE